MSKTKFNIGGNLPEGAVIGETIYCEYEGFEGQLTDLGNGWVRVIVDDRYCEDVPNTTLEAQKEECLKQWREFGD